MNYISLAFPNIDSAVFEDITDQLDTINALNNIEQNHLDLNAPMLNELIITLGSAGVISGVITVITTYLNKHKNSDIQLSRKNGTKISLKGYSPDEIKKIINSIEIE